MLPIVTVFATSPSLRETFTVLLEHDCHLDFARGPAAAIGRSAPAVAVVATDAPIALAAQVSRVWPQVPVIVVSNTESPGFGARHELVGLDPHAIRRTVLKHLRTSSDAALRSCAASIGTALASDWTPRLRRLAGFGGDGGRSVATVADDAAALLADAELLRRFSGRARAARRSEQFIQELVSGLRDRIANAGAAIALAGSCGGSNAHGPLDLADLIASLLAARLRSRQSAAMITAVATGSSLRIAFDRAPAGGATHVELALVLAGLALDPWSWRVLVRSDGASEEIILCPSDATTASLRSS